MGGENKASCGAQTSNYLFCAIHRDILFLNNTWPCFPSFCLHNRCVLSSRLRLAERKLSLCLWPNSFTRISLLQNQPRQSAYTHNPIISVQLLLHILRAGMKRKSFKNNGPWGITNELIHLFMVEQLAPLLFHIGWNVSIIANVSSLSRLKSSLNSLF